VEHTSAGTTQPFVRRVPPAQTAVLLLIVCALAAWNIYGSMSSPVRVFTLVLIAGLLAMVVLALRMYLVADDEGIAVRYLREESWTPWPEVTRIEAVFGVRGGATVRITALDGTHVDVPPSLLQPIKPTGIPRARAQLLDVVRQLEELRSQSGSAG
jgi:hypothetical protein